MNERAQMDGGGEREDAAMPPGIPPNAQVPFATVEELGGVLRPGARGDAVIIDLRAPVEFQADHIPGAVNVPLFEDTTRAFVGLLYKQQSPEAAFQEGRTAVVERIDSLVQEIASHGNWEVPTADLRARVLEMTAGGIARMEEELTPAPVDELPERPVILHCARGGLRSRSVVALLRQLGFRAVIGMEGGYKEYRRAVMDGLKNWQPPPHVFALRGLTGVGKTLVLREIERRRPGWTLDLELHAGHRSSLLGMVGLKPVTQKSFESQLLERAQRGFPDGVAVIEGESRKVGDVVVPGPMWAALQNATNVDVTASIARRVKVLSDDYLRDRSALPKLREQLTAVAERMDGNPDLAGQLDRGEIGPLVELLLERYYDPLYLRSESGKTYGLTVDAGDEGRAAEEIIRWISSAIGA